MPEGQDQASAPSTSSTDGGQAPQPATQASQATPPGAGTGSPATDQASGTAGRVEDLPEWAQNLYRDLRRENAEHRKAKNDADAAAKAAEEKRLADGQEWQKLAEARKAELDKAAPLVERYAKLDALLKKGLQDEVAKWPDEVKAVAPGESDDVLAWLDWVEKFRPLAAKLTGTTAPPTPGNGPAPKPQPSTQENKRAQADFAAAVRGMF